LDEADDVVLQVFCITKTNIDEVDDVVLQVFCIAKTDIDEADDVMRVVLFHCSEYQYYLPKR
ncbi:hypothetical protein SK128_014002, partial [Halocaridina rubra]